MFCRCRAVAQMLSHLIPELVHDLLALNELELLRRVLQTAPLRKRRLLAVSVISMVRLQPSKQFVRLLWKIYKAKTKIVEKVDESSTYVEWEGNTLRDLAERVGLQARSSWCWPLFGSEVHAFGCWRRSGPHRGRPGSKTACPCDLDACSRIDVAHFPSSLYCEVLER